LIFDFSFVAQLPSPVNLRLMGGAFLLARPKTSVPWTVVVRNFGQSGLGEPEMWRSFVRLTPADQVVVLV
jgi:hypothetical protein